MSGPSSAQPIVYTTPIGFKWLFAGCLAIALAMNGLVLAVYLEEGWGAAVALGLVIMPLMTGLAFYYTWLAFQKIVLFKDRLVIKRPIGETHVSYGAITAVEHPGKLILRTAEKSHSIHFPLRRVQSDVWAALNELAPAARAAREGRLVQDLPLVFASRRSAIWTNLFYFAVIGLGMIAFGLGGMWFAVSGGQTEGLGEAVLTFVVSLFILGIGLLMCYLFLFNFTWRHTFDREAIRVRHTLRTAEYRVSDLKSMILSQETRRFRGIERQAHFLEFRFRDGRSFRLEPTENGVPYEFAPEDDRRVLEELQAVLERHYRPAAAPEPDPAPPRPERPPADQWGQADVTQVLRAPLYDVEVQVWNYGEQSPGGYRIHFVLNRPLNGIERLQTVNGEGVLSPNGRYLAIFGALVLSVFDLATERVYRLRDRTEWVYDEVRFDESYLYVGLRDRRTWQKQAALQPIPLEEIAEVLLPQDRERRELVLPQEQFRALVNHARYLPEKQLASQFETLRDVLHGLGAEILPDVLFEAQQPRSRGLHELLITVLVDQGYPPAMPLFVERLDSPSEEIRFACATALDRMAGGRFEIGEMIAGGWVQHDRVLAAVPAIKTWWQEEGRALVPSEREWRAEREQQRPATEREKRYNFVELNPQWVMQGDGNVQPPAEGYRLPRGKGIHVVGGRVRLPGENEERFAAFEVDSHDENIIGVFVRVDGAWRNVLGETASAVLNVDF